MQWIELSNLNTEIGAAPVDCQTYCAYLSSSDRSLPQCPSTGEQPLVGISASEARAFAAWLTRRDKRIYRLPTLHELRELAQQSARGQDSWPCLRNPGAGGPIPSCSYEWIDCTPDPAGQRARLHCATYPLWLQQPQRRPIRAALVDTALPYATFRLVRTALDSRFDPQSLQGAYI